MTLFEKIFSIKQVLVNLIRLMTHRYRILMLLVLVMTIGFSLVETIGISAIMPFISVVEIY